MLCVRVVLKHLLFLNAMFLNITIALDNTATKIFFRGIIFSKVVVISLGPTNASFLEVLGTCDYKNRSYVSFLTIPTNIMFSLTVITKYKKIVPLTSFHLQQSTKSHESLGGVV